MIGFVCGQIMESSTKSVHLIKLESKVESKVSMLCQNLAFSNSMLCLHRPADLHALPNHYHVLVHARCCISKRHREV